MNSDERRFDGITEQIIGAAYEVANELGAGFLERVYENSTAIVLRGRGLRVELQKPLQVTFRGVEVGSYFADMLVEESVLVEFKCVSAITDSHVAQCLNYLKATGLNLCLIVNFGKPKVEVRRVVRNL